MKTLLILAMLLIASACTGSPGGGFHQNPYEFVLGRYYFQAGDLDSFVLYIERFQPGGFNGLLDVEGWIELSHADIPRTGRMYFKDDRVEPPNIIMPQKKLHTSTLIVSSLFTDKHRQLLHPVFSRIEIRAHGVTPDVFVVDLTYQTRDGNIVLTALAER